MLSRQLFLMARDLLHVLHEDTESPLLLTLALMVSGLILGRSVQFHELAVWVPSDIALLSAVRRFERFVANPEVKVAAFFEPFVLAMQASLSYETAYLILDCTQVGRQCRTLLAALAYHNTVLPLGWKTIAGKKGHVTGEFQLELLKRLQLYLNTCQHIVVLGDAEYCNATLINWVRQQGWDFICHVRENCLLCVPGDRAWQPVRELLDDSDLHSGQVRHWEPVLFTMEHRIPGLTFTIHWGAGEAEPLCLISSLPAAQAPHVLYDQRFWIETVFGTCKSRAFGLARTHLTDPEHIDRLILAIAVATCMALGLGTHMVLTQQTARVDRADRRDLSLFQIGWRWLHRLLALDRLREFKMQFTWHFVLPEPGFRPAI